MKQILTVTLLTALVLAYTPFAAAQQPTAAPAPMVNLQVFPKDTARADVIARMQAFNQALGVTCAHCHVLVGPNNPGNDFATDKVPAKEKTRLMMRATGEFNTKLGLSGQPTAVTCATCHRGAAIPKLDPPPAPTK